MDLGGDEYFPFQGHNMRIYCVKFNKDIDNPNLLYSAGWDQNLTTWDLRTRKPVSNIYGPLICGDGIDNVGTE
jgi:WD40 repeat protein